jgi:CheY-like chemotaxis protein
MTAEPITLTRVLLVEDKPEDVQLFSLELAKAPVGRFAVQTADCLSTAIALAKAGNVDVVVLDLSLPDGSGIDALERMIQAAPAVPIVVLTGAQSERLGLEAIRKGAEDHLVKGALAAPAVAHALLFAIERSVFREHSTRREHLLGDARRVAALGSFDGDVAPAATGTDRPKSEYLAKLSHELRTPLHAIIGFAELMFRGKVGPVADDHKEYLGEILDSSRNLLQLVEGLSDFVRAERAKGLGPEPADLQEVDRTARPAATILVVDDSEAGAKLARVVLEHDGYQVHTATDAEEALRALSLRMPSLVLIDVQLPGMNGLELTRRLRADAATKDLVILAVTASTTKSDEEKARSAGCDGFLAKPIDIRSLSRMVREHLGARRPSS